MSQDIPPIAALAYHRVADFDAWKTVFDAHQADRVQASCLGHHINRGADDPNMVYIYCPATDVDKLKAFLDSAQLAAIMKSSGVQGPPTIKLMTPKSSDFIPDQKLAGVIMFHPVEDYDAWRVVYDEGDDLRQKNGIVGHAVNQELGKPNEVIIYDQANDLASLRAFVDSAELRGAMQRAGVTSPPEIHFVQSVDFAEY